MKAVKYGLICVNVLLISISICIVLSGVGNHRVKTILLLCVACFGLMNLACYFYFRKRFVDFTNEMCRQMEEVLHGNSIKQVHNRETLTSKMVTEMEKVEDIFAFQLEESRKEKKELQEMVSEITHQIKTPISNIQMFCEMFSDPEVTAPEGEKFIEVIRQQLGKLEFLLNTLVKASRLEAAMINIEMQHGKVIETLAAAVNNIMQKAECKNIDISVACRPSISVYHDAKWTAEAIENLLDNAIKYTPENGKVMLYVNVGEMYTEIKVKDNGKGIKAAHVNDIFKRFYREKSVSKMEGLGLGLYLARNIITMQGGYISVRSAEGKGSCFSVCLPNRAC